MQHIRKKIAVGITGASGIPYGIRLVEALAGLGHEVLVVVSEAGREVMRLECGCAPEILAKLGVILYGEDDISAPIAAAAITGTNLRMRVDPDSTTQLKVYKGEVQITNAPERKDLKPKSLKPHQVPGPREIPGPREVTLEEWVYIVKSMQQITIDKMGQVVSMSGFKPSDPDEKDGWVQWNQRRDERRVRRLKQIMK